MNYLFLIQFALMPLFQSSNSEFQTVDILRVFGIQTMNPKLDMTERSCMSL